MGVKFNDVNYALSGEKVSLNFEASAGCGAISGFKATKGTLSGSSNPYSLTKPPALTRRE